MFFARFLLLLFCLFFPVVGGVPVAAHNLCVVTELPTDYRRAAVTGRCPESTHSVPPPLPPVIILEQDDGFLPEAW